MSRRQATTRSIVLAGVVVGLVYGLAVGLHSLASGLTASKLADSLADLAILQLYEERYRSEKHEPFLFSPVVPLMAAETCNVFLFESVWRNCLAVSVDENSVARGDWPSIEALLLDPCPFIRRQIARGFPQTLPPPWDRWYPQFLRPGQTDELLQSFGCNSQPVHYSLKVFVHTARDRRDYAALVR